MKLDGIAAFVAVAEAGSISEAARRLRLSKSVVSERLAELERSLATILLHRTTRKLSLTEDGVAFLDRAGRIVREVQDAVTDLSERRKTLAGPLRISAPVTFGRVHLGPALYPFLLRHPQIELTLDLDDRRVDAAADGYDAVVRHGVLDDSRLKAWRLAPSRRVLVASPDYLARSGAPRSLAELNGHRGIFYTNRGNADWRFDTPSGTVVVRAKLGLRVNNGDLIRDAAVAGLGIALLPLFIAEQEIRAGRLTVIEVGCQADDELLFMAYPSFRPPAAKLRVLAEHLRAVFQPACWDRLPGA